MDWTQIGVILGVNGVLFGSAIALLVWMRSESRSDYRHLHDIQRDDRRDFITLINAIKEDVMAIKEDVRAIHQEMKDFHGRLCAIEERSRTK